MPVFEYQGTSIYYEQHGDGFPLLLLSPGGLNSTIEFWSRLPFNPVEVFRDEFHVVAMDQRNAGRSSGPLPIADPWGGYADDQLALMDSLGIDRFLTMGCCIGCSFILKLIGRAPQRVVAGVMEQPIGEDHTNPGFFGPRMYTEWGEKLSAARPDVTMDQVKTFGEGLFEGEFVFSVPRSFLPTVHTPLLVLPGDDPAHPKGVGLEVAQLLPQSELLEEWKAPPEIVPQTIDRVRAFLRAHTPEKVIT